MYQLQDQRPPCHNSSAPWKKVASDKALEHGALCASVVGGKMVSVHRTVTTYGGGILQVNRWRARWLIRTFPLLCAPTTTIWGSCKESEPTVAKTSCSLFITGISCSMATNSGTGQSPLSVNVSVWDALCYNSQYVCHMLIEWTMCHMKGQSAIAMYQG
jgi:hypothetical protein